MARIIELIISEERLKGNGTPENPYRRCTELYTKEGQQIAEYDSYSKESWFNPILDALLNNRKHQGL